MHWLANRDETQVSLEHVSDKCLDDKLANRVVVRINGCHKNHIPAFLHFIVQLEHGIDEEGNPCRELPILALSVHKEFLFAVQCFPHALSCQFQHCLAPVGASKIFLFIMMLSTCHEERWK